MPHRLLDFSAAFSRFRGSDPDRLHFAAHSHHAWPDLTRDAQTEAWDAAARLIDDKWDEVLGQVWTDVATHIAGHLRLPHPATLVPAPNTHELVNRLLSCGPVGRPMKVLATDGEFHSFRRQTERLAEDGLIALQVVAAEPFGTLSARLIEAAKAQQPDMVFFSQVLFGSGFCLTDLTALVDALDAPERLVVIDGYHGFMARPTDISAIADRAFYIAGGYKYAMSGEGACFMHCPPGRALRPRNTGWFASFGTLSGPQGGVGYTADGWRFMGSTFDPSGLYRMRTVMKWLAASGLDAARIHDHVVALQERFVAQMAERPVGIFEAQNLVVPLSEASRGNFLAFEHADAQAWYKRLHEANIVTDVRGSRLRVGFGLYQTAQDVDAMVARLRTLA